MALVIFLLLTLMVILSGPGTPPDYPSSDPGLGGPQVPENEEDRLSAEHGIAQLVKHPARVITAIQEQ